MARPETSPDRLDVHIRRAHRDDVRRILEIGGAVYPDWREFHAIEDFEAQEDRLRAGGYVSVHGIGQTTDGLVVGFYRFRHMPGQYRPDRYALAVFTHPNWQGRGAGRALYDHALAALEARGARVLESFAREDMPHVIDFLERRGFREAMRTWEMRLDLTRFDPAPFAVYTERVQEAGVEIVTLADERRRSPDALRRAYSLHTVLMADIPSPIPYTPVPFEHFVAAAVEAPHALPDAYFLARAGDDYVGEATLHTPAKGTVLHHDVTGVLRSHRGRGIAMVLKLATIAYGRIHGYTEIRTWNEIQNTGMLVINDRLGFTRRPAWITYEKHLTSARS